MLTDAQKAARRIGGSDIATIMGLNPYRTARDLYDEIMGTKPPFEGNEHTQAGEVMESAIADLYALRTGKTVRKSNLTHAHPDHPFLTAHIDRWTVGEKRIVEIKNVGRHGARQWGEPGTDEAPVWYLMQAHHYMLVLDYPAADIVAYFGGGDLAIYPVERNADIDRAIIEAGAKFWSCVETQTPPEIDLNHPAAIDTLKRIYPGTDGEATTGDDLLLAWSKVERDAAAMITRYEKVQEGAKARILDAMGEAALITMPDGSKYTRKQITRAAYSVEASEYVQLTYKKAP